MSTVWLLLALLHPGVFARHFDSTAGVAVQAMNDRVIFTAHVCKHHLSLFVLRAATAPSFSMSGTRNPNTIERAWAK